jgi:hypothetical protein
LRDEKIGSKFFAGWIACARGIASLSISTSILFLFQLFKRERDMKATAGERLKNDELREKTTLSRDDVLSTINDLDQNKTGIPLDSVLPVLRRRKSLGAAELGDDGQFVPASRYGGRLIRRLQPNDVTAISLMIE